MPCWGVCILLTEVAAAFQIQNGPPAGSGHTWPAWPNARAWCAELDMVGSPRDARTAVTYAVASLRCCLGGLLYLSVCSIEPVRQSSFLTRPASPQLPAQGGLGKPLVPKRTPTSFLGMLDHAAGARVRLGCKGWVSWLVRSVFGVPEDPKYTINARTPSTHVS
jgi:hypothetical protein